MPMSAHNLDQALKCFDLPNCQPLFDNPAKIGDHAVNFSRQLLEAVEVSRFAEIGTGINFHVAGMVNYRRIRFDDKAETVKTSM